MKASNASVKFAGNLEGLESAKSKTIGWRRSL